MPPSWAAFLFSGRDQTVSSLHSYNKMIFLFMNWLRIKDQSMVQNRTTRTADAGVKTPRRLDGDGGGGDHPLLWMARRKDGAGEAMIGPAAFAAGQRLAADLVRGGMLPRVTMAWSNEPRAERGGARIVLHPTEAMLAARQRVDAAMRAVGPEFSGLLMDLCGFAKGLELIEQERRWPARSAKVVVRIALQVLARHYGYDDVAVGRDTRQSRVWATVDARPKITDLPFVGLG
jgi:hypothetical protein